MRTEEFNYELPTELIAQTPSARGHSRLLVLHRTDGRLEHRRFQDLPEYLSEGDTFVLNDTRVTARRLIGLREAGQQAEVLLLRPNGSKSWEALVRPGKSLRPGKRLTLFCGERHTPCVQALITATTPDGGRILELNSTAERDALAEWGVAPLPPYIHTPLPAAEEERYQTVYSQWGGSAAAPTAGLHFTPELLAQMARNGVGRATVTLHVGVGTFRPVRTENVADHEMHGEWVHLSAPAAEAVNHTRRRVVAVGTTSTRTLESAAAHRTAIQRQEGVRVVAFEGETRLFITPGYEYQAVDALITNFHLPCSTLLMLVCAFAGYESTLHAYREAIRLGYRFFSFGDAMLIL
jgi:S-adenosylmethionine:tRNA ribosyltransferase-isomerase